MLKTSVFAKATVFAVLIALVVASFPTSSVMAKKGKEGLEGKWSQLVDNYTRQSFHHNSMHKWVDRWQPAQRKNSFSDRDNVQKHLTICNSAILAAGNIVFTHAGFDAKGKVIDRGAAIKSIKDLSYYLRQHAGSLKNLDAYVNS
jgi:hypothetical protein